jgi:molecular chaperone GrpE
LSDEDPADDGPESPEEGADPGPEEQAQPELEAKAASLAEALEAPPEGDAAEAFHQRARLAEDRLAEVLGAYRKMRVDNDGYRERTTKNIERRYDQRRERLLVKFIDILDNLDRALDAAEQTYAGNPLIEGLILVRTQLLQTLKEEGLERIPAIGMPYDPNHSEAVQTQIVEDAEHHHIVMKELLRGYRLNGRVARPSRVIVGEHTGEPKAPAEPAPAEPESAAVLTASATRAAATDAPAPGEPSLEEIVSRAEAQEALFPGAFEDAKKED